MKFRNVKIYGAGSIGNHLAHACRKVGMSVDMVDLDPLALVRTRDEIYPSRYGAWDAAIRTYEAGSAPVGGYDLICIGTPPESHISLALDAVSENPRAILIEKPVSGHDTSGLDELLSLAKAKGIRLFVGYDHVVGAAVTAMTDWLGSKREKVLTIDVEFREHWGGIFAAHPWLSGPHDSYLGFSHLGGGACSEHSHAINLWQHLSLITGNGRIASVFASFAPGAKKNTDYDEIATFTFKSESGLLGRCIQDVVTRPSRKWARVQLEDSAIDWRCGSGSEGLDQLSIWEIDNPEPQNIVFNKTRPDDFISEVIAIEQATFNNTSCPVDLVHGVDTQKVILAAFESGSEGSFINVEY